jgi:hypothetical protein
MKAFPLSPSGTGPGSFSSGAPVLKAAPLIKFDLWLPARIETTLRPLKSNKRGVELL